LISSGPLKKVGSTMSLSTGQPSGLGHFSIAWLVYGHRLEIGGAALAFG